MLVSAVPLGTVVSRASPRPDEIDMGTAARPLSRTGL
jgi:hypothetical protein